jgi:hypothetical protein
LERGGQEKNRRRHAPTFTPHAQFFHSTKVVQFFQVDADFGGICEQIFTSGANDTENNQKFA